MHWKLTQMPATSLSYPYFLSVQITAQGAVVGIVHDSPLEPDDTCDVGLSGRQLQLEECIEGPREAKGEYPGKRPRYSKWRAKVLTTTQPV